VRRVVTTEFEVHGFIPEDSGAFRLVLAIGTGDDARIVGTTYPIGADDAEVLSSLVPRSVPGSRRIWGPFESDRHDVWFQLPRGLIAEVVIAGIDSDVLRQPAKFVRWRVSAPP
jgi:ATP-dependent DNA ligase